MVCVVLVLYVKVNVPLLLHNICNPYVTSYLTQRSALKCSSAGWERNVDSVQGVQLCVLRWIKSELQKQTERRNSGGISAFTEYYGGDCVLLL